MGFLVSTPYFPSQSNRKGLRSPYRGFAPVPPGYLSQAIDRSEHKGYEQIAVQAGMPMTAQGDEVGGGGTP